MNHPPFDPAAPFDDFGLPEDPAPLSASRSDNPDMLTIEITESAGFSVGWVEALLLGVLLAAGVHYLRGGR